MHYMFPSESKCNYMTLRFHGLNIDNILRGPEIGSGGDVRLHPEAK